MLWDSVSSSWSWSCLIKGALSAFLSFPLDLFLSKPFFLLFRPHRIAVSCRSFPVLCVNVQSFHSALADIFVALRRGGQQISCQKLIRHTGYPLGYDCLPSGAYGQTDAAWIVFISGYMVRRPACTGSWTLANLSLHSMSMIWRWRFTTPASSPLCMAVDHGQDTPNKGESWTITW